ncbi:uncharacterized protein LOC121199905 [Lates japonicus]
MLLSGMLHRLLLAGTCLCVYGTPVHLSNFTPSDCDGECASSLTTVRSTHVTDVTKSKPSGRPCGPAPPPAPTFNIRLVTCSVSEGLDFVTSVTCVDLTVVSELAHSPSQSLGVKFERWTGVP